MPVKPAEATAAPTAKAPAAKKKAISVKPLEAKPATDKVQAVCRAVCLSVRILPTLLLSVRIA